MRIHRNIFRYTILLAFFLVLSPSIVSAWWWNYGSQCDDVVNRENGGYINVLTFNILFFAPGFSVVTRMDPVVEFLKDQMEPVDLIFLQEVVGGELALSDAPNSAKYLQERLAAGGLEYNLRTAFEIGIPGLFFTGNSILSRCEIKFSLVKRLPRESEIEIFDRVIKLPRNVQMARIKIPGFGKFNAYHTHLCAGCNVNERGEQLTKLFDFLWKVENFIPGKNPILLAGDFNIDLFKDKAPGETFGPEMALYEAVTANGFIDVYADFFGGPSVLHTLCPEEDIEDMEDMDAVHCTVGTTAFDLDDPGNASRIDYVFRKGFGTASAAKVFFNPKADLTEPIVPVSDHSAVLVSIPLH